MDKVKKWVVDLADPMLKAYINYGHGLEEDGVSVTAKGIEFLAEFEPDISLSGLGFPQNWQTILHR